jgi:F-type H+-transporting ATPase subunit alpha
MKQKQYAPMSVGLMALSLYAVNEGYIDAVPAKSVVAYETALHAFAKEKHGALIEQINAKGDFNDDIAAGLKKICEDFKTSGAY